MPWSAPLFPPSLFREKTQFDFPAAKPQKQLKSTVSICQWACGSVHLITAVHLPYYCSTQCITAALLLHYPPCYSSPRFSPSRVIILKKILFYNTKTGFQIPKVYIERYATAIPHRVIKLTQLADIRSEIYNKSLQLMFPHLPGKMCVRDP